MPFIFSTINKNSSNILFKNDSIVLLSWLCLPSISYNNSFFFFYRFSVFCLPLPSPRGFRIHWLLLCREVRLPSTIVLDMALKQFDSEAPELLELWGRWSPSPLQPPPGPLWPGVAGSHRALSMVQIKLFDILTECKQMNYAELSCLKWQSLII